MPPDPTPTRKQLVDAGLRLFALKGIHGASLLEITRAAHQRNNSALRYHFKSREGLLRAILEPHVLALRETRLQMLKDAKSASEKTMHLFAGVYIRPFADLVQGGWRERAYLKISAELIADPAGSTDEVISLLGAAEGARVIDHIIALCSPMPRGIRAERISLATAFAHRAVADRARSIDTLRRGERALLSHEEFVANLIDMFVASILAPVTGDARGAPSPSSLGRKPSVTATDDRPKQSRSGTARGRRQHH